MTLTVGVGTDEDPDAAAAGDVVRRQSVDVAADCRPAQRRFPRAGLPAPHSRRPHGGRLPAWLYTHTRTEGGTMLVRPGAYTQGTCMLADPPPKKIHPRTRGVNYGKGFILDTGVVGKKMPRT